MDTTRASLLIRLRDRADQSAWREFDALYRPMLLRFARNRGLHDTESEEVAQACLAAITEQIDKFEYDPQRGRFKSWLRTLVNNRIRTIRRRRAPLAPGSTVLDGIPEDDDTPPETFERVWHEEHLRHALEDVRREVEPETMEAFELYVLKELPADEVCRLLNTTPQRLYQTRWRIIEKLNQKMQFLLSE